MTTNQTIDGVPRELLADLAAYGESGKVSEPWMVEKLRALLDAKPAEFTGDDVLRWMDQRASAQPHGEPAGIQVGSGLQGQSFIRNCQVTCCGSCIGGCTIGAKP